MIRYHGYIGHGNGSVGGLPSSDHYRLCWLPATWQNACNGLGTWDIRKTLGVDGPSFWRAGEKAAPAEVPRVAPAEPLFTTVHALCTPRPRNFAGCLFSLFPMPPAIPPPDKDQTKWLMPNIKENSGWRDSKLNHKTMQSTLLDQAWYILPHPNLLCSFICSLSTRSSSSLLLRVQRPIICFYACLILDSALFCSPSIISHPTKHAEPIF